jgi:hypothetical protein
VWVWLVRAAFVWVCWEEGRCEAALRGPRPFRHPLTLLLLPLARPHAHPYLPTHAIPYSAQYLSLSLDQLCAMFELPPKRVYR